MDNDESEFQSQPTFNNLSSVSALGTSFNSFPSYDQAPTSPPEFIPPLFPSFNAPRESPEYRPFSNFSDTEEAPKDSGNASLNSVAIEPEKSAADAELQQVFGFGVRSAKVLPPQRPPPPQAKVVRQAPLPPTKTSSSTPPFESWEYQFAKVVEELLASETNYNQELNAWEDVSL